MMARSSRYCVPFRRRREGKTDYRIRKAFVLSGKPRLVARCSNRNASAQIVLAKPRGDEILVSAHSRDLRKNFGWKSPLGNLPCAYLTGYLCGLKAKTKDVQEVILDLGLQSPSKGAKVFAVLKGIIDAGIEVPYSEEKLPEEKRMEGEHIAKYATALTSDSEAYKSRFSKYLKEGLPPEELPKHFAEIKEGITAAFKEGAKKDERRQKKKKT